jgi:hypothetical protein
VKLKGILDFSLGDFLCLRGFAPMGVLFDLSEADPSFHRHFPRLFVLPTFLGNFRVPARIPTLEFQPSNL